jgi:hypothetical protein
MDQLLSERDPVNRELRRIIDELAEGPWGIRVERVEIKDVSLPDAMKWSMSRQAGAERERRARIITADGEYQASKRLAAAANVMARDPAALQLRLLQAVVEVASERNSALVMPVPVELLRFFDKMTPAGPGAGLSPSLADFGDAEVAKAEAAIEGRPSAAGPPDAIPPVEAPGIKGSPDHRGRGASRMAVGGCRDLPGRLRTGKGASGARECPNPRAARPRSGSPRRASRCRRSQFRWPPTCQRNAPAATSIPRASCLSWTGHLWPPARSEPAVAVAEARGLRADLCANALAAALAENALPSRHRPPRGTSDHQHERST